MEKLKQSTYDLEDLELILEVLKVNHDSVVPSYYLEEIILKIENDIEYHKNKFKSVFKF